MTVEVENPPDEVLVAQGGKQAGQTRKSLHIPDETGRFPICRVVRHKENKRWVRKSLEVYPPAWRNWCKWCVQEIGE